MSEKLVTLSQTEYVRQMANEKRVGRVKFQNALDDGSFARFLDTLKSGLINCNLCPEIPDWADKDEPIIAHIPCGMADPSILVAYDIFVEGDGDSLDGETYIARAVKLEGSLNACAFDFYARPENWMYLPKKDVDVIFFPKTIFRDSGGDRCVRFLCRSGAGWRRGYDWLGCRFGRGYRVALSQVSPSVSVQT